MAEGTTRPKWHRYQHIQRRVSSTPPERQALEQGDKELDEELDEEDRVAGKVGDRP